jgi:type VI secretion system Hcp family effector
MELSDPAVWGETYDEQFGMGPKGRKLGAFEIFKFDFSVSAKDDDADADKSDSKAVGGTARGKAAAKHSEATLDTFSIAKYIDKASPDLFLACCKKNMIEWGIISVRETGDPSRKPFLILEFQNLKVTGFKWSLDPGADAQSAAQEEEVTFNFETILIKYARQQSTGEHSTVKIKGFNRMYPDRPVTEIPWDTLAAQVEDH